jgi:asparagine synthase (glutamine-hydrolysing)
LCGICGFLGKIENKIDVIKKMTDVIKHRGPDDVNFFTDSYASMGFRRLSIIDLNSGGQPIYNEDKNLVLTFNGEIYNYIELREILKSKGHEFYTQTDSEVIVHGFEEWGEEVSSHLRGMFAFAIWNCNKKTLFLSRDFFGIKPLNYSIFEKKFIYGSEIKSILEFTDFKKELNLNALDKYLSFQYVPGNETFFKNIFCLPPGHSMMVEFENILSFNIKKYFEPKFNPDEDLTLKNASEQIEEIFEESVDSHRISDVEVGCFLSSGIDSSLVASYFEGQKSFTVGFSESEKYNEISWATKFSEFAKIKNFNHVISPEEYWESIETVMYFMDQPLADPSCIALYFVCKLAKEHVKVVLSGEGADELFGGYPVYNQPRVFSLYQKIFPQSIRSLFANFVKKIPFSFKGRGFLIRGENKIEDKFIGNAFIFSKDEKQKILKNSDLASDPLEITKEFYKKASLLDDVTKMQFLDVNLWMVGDILLKADRMSMANSIELRVPFLDTKVFEIASRLPPKLKVTRKNTKFALRAAASKRLPHATAEKQKLGFPVPIRVWLRQKKYYDIVLSAFESQTAKQFFNIDYLRKILEEHYNKKWDLSRKIWAIYIFIVWYDIYFKGPCSYRD